MLVRTTFHPRAHAAYSPRIDNTRRGWNGEVRSPWSDSIRRIATKVEYIYRHSWTFRSGAGGESGLDLRELPAGTASVARLEVNRSERPLPLQSMARLFAGAVIAESA